MNSEGVWSASEGELGLVTLVDDKNNNLGELAILRVVEGFDWMTSNPVPFKTNLIFDNKGAKKGTLIIKSNAGEGDGDEAGKTHTIKIKVRF